MKKYLALVLAFSMLLCSCKKSDESSTKDEIEVNTTIKVITTSPPETTTTSINNDDVIVPAPYEPPCFNYNDTIHVITNSTYRTFYDGKIFEFDYSLLDGYIFLGTTYGSVDDPSYALYNFNHYNFADGVPILYNEEKNSFLFWQQYGNNKVKISEHICDSSCYAIADQ